jgi:hypothetical protein
MEASIVPVILLDHVCSWCAAVLRIIYSVPSCRKSCLFFLCFVWFVIANETPIRCLLHSVLWNLIFVNEKDGVGAFTSSSGSLC